MADIQLGKSYLIPNSPGQNTIKPLHLYNSETAVTMSQGGSGDVNIRQNIWP